MCCHGEVWLPEEPRHLSLVSRLVRRAIWPFCMDNPSRVLPYWNSFVVGGRWSGIHTGRPMKLTAKQKDEETTTVYSKDIISVVKSCLKNLRRRFCFGTMSCILQRQQVVSATL